MMQEIQLQKRLILHTHKQHDKPVPWSPQRIAKTLSSHQATLFT
jgi:hypothetical protein